MIHIQRVNPETGQTSEVIELDATLDVNLSHAMTVTDFPVEDGANISDHAQEQPASVTIRSVVSATPLRVFSFDPIIGDSRPRAALEVMLELQQNRELVRIVSDLKTYDNMALTSLAAPRRQDTKNALLFTATFREVRIVSSQIVVLPPEEEVQQTATVKEEGGKATPQPTESEQEVEEASYLYRTLQGIGVIE
jgi:hypothetical protein